MSSAPEVKDPTQAIAVETVATPVQKDAADTEMEEMTKRLIPLAKEEIIQMFIETSIDLAVLQIKVDEAAEAKKAEEEKQAREQESARLEKVKKIGINESIFKSSTKEVQDEFIKIASNMESSNGKRKNEEDQGPVKVTKASFQDYVQKSARSQLKVGKSTHVERDFDKSEGQQVNNVIGEKDTSKTLKHSPESLKDLMKSRGVAIAKELSSGGANYQGSLLELTEKTRDSLNSNKSGWGK